MTVHVQLDAADAASLDRLVEGGNYSLRDDAVREAIRRLSEHDAAWIEMVRAKVEEGRAQIARGEGLSIEEVRENLRQHLGTPP